MGLALARTTPTWIGGRPSTICGRKSTRHLVEQAAHARQEEAAHHQRLLNAHTVRAHQQEAACQEAARAAQRLLHKCTALERQGEAAPCQRLLDKQSARR